MLQKDHRAPAATRLPYAILAFLLVGCGNANTASPPSKKPADNTPTVKTIIPPVNDLAPINHTPSFAPDYNHLTAQPWVEPVTTTERDGVDVYPDHLVFPDTMTEVGKWEPGRLVVSAPGQGAGKNALGFARRVVKVEHVGSTYVVTTSIPAMEDILQGDFQMQLKPEAMTPMDKSKADLQWVADNLYFQSPTAHLMTGEPLVDDWPEGQPAMDIWDTLGGVGKDIGNGLITAADAVAAGAKEAYLAITPDTIGGSVNLSPTIDFGRSSTLFDMKYQKTFNSEGKLPFTVALSGSGDYKLGLTMKPGTQVGADFAIPGHDAKSDYWLNVDSSMEVLVALNLDFSAAITSGGGKTGAALQKSLDEGGTLAQDLLTSERKKLFGDPDMKPEGHWKKTLWISDPATETFLVGPVPVPVTETLQVDLECGFQAKAAVKAQLVFYDNATMQFSVKNGEATNLPTFKNTRQSDVQVTGEGSVMATCGLVPRVNVFFYDMVGMFAGMRGSLVAEGDYESKCKSDPNDPHPDGELTLGLYGELAVRAGGRIQAPGSSYAGTAGTKLGKEKEIEPWSKRWTLEQKKWTFPYGFGYCLPSCRDGAKDGNETGVDCGGSCGGCPLGSACRLNSECTKASCSHGICSQDTCGDGVQDSDETDVDCGGQDCVPCADGEVCDSGSDCQSTFCALSATNAYVCATKHCTDGVLDADEGGVDCGGSTCKKCATGAFSTTDSACASGFSNGTICVPSACFDMRLSSGETDVDCGGSTCAQRCGFEQACNQSSDCQSGLSCSPTRHVCLRGLDAKCMADSDCLSSHCSSSPGVCVANVTGCGDGILDGAETDVDCGGPTCKKCPVNARCMQGSDCQLGLCTPFAGSGAYQCTAPANIVADWPFDGDGKDASGHGHDATFTGGAAGYTNLAHSGTEALSFDGNFWGTVPALDLGDKFTIAAWVYVPSSATVVPEVLVSSGPSGPTDGIIFYVHSLDSADFSLGFATGDGSSFCFWQTSPGMLLGDEWQHVAVTVDRAAGTAILYVSGKAMTGSGCFVQTFPTNAALTIGAMPGGMSPAMDNLDDLRIYNTILTPAQIAALAQ